MKLLALFLLLGPPAQQAMPPVRSTEPAAWAAALPLRPALRVGALDGPPEYSFGSIQQLAATTTGTFVTYDGSDTQLRRYDAAGKFLGLIGRAGAGPGEYRAVEGLLFVGDSLLVVWDPPNQRISLFSAAGEYRRSIQVPGGVFGGERPLLPAPGDRFLVRVARPGATRETAFRTEYLVFDAAGQVHDTLPDPSGNRDDAHFVLMTSDGPRWNFPAESLYAWTPGGDLLRGHSAEMGFWIVPRNGPARHVTRATRALPLEGAERKQWEDWGALFAERAGKPARPLPASKPLARSLRADPANRVWVEVYAEATPRPPKPRPPGDQRPQFTLRDATTYEVFTDTGRYLGRVAMEPESTVLAITATRLFVLGHGPDGEEQVVVYNLPPG